MFATERSNENSVLSEILAFLYCAVKCDLKIKNLPALSALALGWRGQLQFVHGAIVRV